jgi:NADH-ubiquinone oxidoreductase chain 4
VPLLCVLLIIPIIGIFLISTIDSFSPAKVENFNLKANKGGKENSYPENLREKAVSILSEGDVFNADNKDYLFDVSYYKKIAFATTILNLIVSLIIYMLFDFSNNQFQFIQENLDLSFYDIYLGLDGVSIYFVLLTTIIMPIALVSN